jgi:hypothetical protein
MLIVVYAILPFQLQKLRLILIGDWVKAPRCFRHPSSITRSASRVHAASSSSVRRYAASASASAFKPVHGRPQIILSRSVR